MIDLFIHNVPHASAFIDGCIVVLAYWLGRTHGREALATAQHNKTVWDRYRDAPSAPPAKDD